MFGDHSVDIRRSVENTQTAFLFQTDYHACRQQFLSACNEAWENAPEIICRQKSWRLAESDLYTDAVWFGNPDAERCVVLISATHGVEGFCGSAAQQYVLQSLERYQSLWTDNCAVVMVHALNPWGMHWARRCDQDGIDLNRNFIDFRQMPQADERYAEVLAVLHLPQAQREIAMRRLCIEWGQIAFDRICSGGQYTDDWAPFFGGKKPAWSRHVIEALIADWQLAQRELIVIDIHSGLGSWAYGELISDHPTDSAAANYAQRVFSAAVAQTDTGASSSVAKHGLLDYHWHQYMHQRGCFLTLEFGTYATQDLFEVINADHILWQQFRASAGVEKDLAGAQNSIGDSAYTQQYTQQRSAMIQHFCPTDELWQQAVLFKVWQVFDRAFKFISYPVATPIRLDQ